MSGLGSSDFDRESHRRAGRWIAGELAKASAMMAASSRVVDGLKAWALAEGAKAREVYEDMGPLGKARVASGEGLGHFEMLEAFVKEVQALAAGGARVAIDLSGAEPHAPSGEAASQVDIGGRLRSSRTPTPPKTSKPGPASK